MSIMSLEELRDALQDRRLDVVSRATGIHANTLGKIKRGEQQNPKLSTVEALSEYFNTTCHGGCK